jgi:mannose-6-phosphate isomerase-like protein (cupin superfamily)
MAVLIKKPSIITASGNKPKQIQEFVGRVNSSTSETSIARMISPQGWIEPGQIPEFDEYTLVLKGMLKVETRNEILLIGEGQAVIAQRGEWVRYSTPDEGGAEYIAVCLPAFSIDTVHRDSN